MISLYVLAAAAEAKPVIVGLGDSTCAVAMAPDHDARSFDYVLGIWTGMNMVSNKAVGHSTDARGILKEVVAACAAAPTLPLAEATLGVHMRMEREGR